MAIIEHHMPAVNVGEAAHVDNETCWCKPTEVKVWEGSSSEKSVWTHYRPGKKPKKGRRQ